MKKHRVSPKDVVATADLITALFGVYATLDALRSLPAPDREKELEAGKISLVKYAETVATSQARLSTDTTGILIEPETIQAAKTSQVQTETRRAKIEHLIARTKGRTFGDVLQEASRVIGAFGSQPAVRSMADDGPGALCVVGGALAIAGALTGNPGAFGVGLIVVAAEC